MFLEDPISNMFLWIFILSIGFGLVARGTEFCPLGGVADILHSRDNGRLRMYFFTIAVAILGVTIVETMGLLNMDETRPPYRGSQFRWAGYLVGGLLFGIGMTMCRGCGMKNMINLGSGNLKALVAILGMGGAAVLLLYVEGVFDGYVQSWIGPSSPDLAHVNIEKQDLGSIAAKFTGMDVTTLRTAIGFGLGGLMALYAFRSADFRARKANAIGGLLIGAIIVGAYYLSGGPIGEAAIEASDFAEQPQNGMGLQSYTFIRPMGDLLYVASNPEFYVVTFGLVAFLGVGAGSLIMSIFSGGWRWQWFDSAGEFIRYAVGGALVGIGGIIGLGCTLGQGVAGTSTLALGSFMNLLALLFGAWIGIKMQGRFLHDHELPR